MAVVLSIDSCTLKVWTTKDPRSYYWTNSEIITMPLVYYFISYTDCLQTDLIFDDISYKSIRYMNYSGGHTEHPFMLIVSFAGAQQTTCMVRTAGAATPP